MTVLTPGAPDGDVPLPKLRGQWDTQGWLPPLLVDSENYELGVCSAQHVHPASRNEKPDVGAAGQFGAQPSHHQRNGPPPARRSWLPFYSNKAFFN